MIPKDRGMSIASMMRVGGRREPVRRPIGAGTVGCDGADRLATAVARLYGPHMSDRIFCGLFPESWLRSVIAAAAGVTMATGAAFAENARTPPARSTLPGVDDSYRIVKPAPEPDNVRPGNGAFKIGDMDVQISGSVILDVGVGSTPSPR